MPDLTAGLIGGNILGGLLGADAASDAASTQANAAANAAASQLQASREANALQKEMFDKQIELQEPFRQGGLAAQNQLLKYLALGGDTSAPGYGRYAQDFSMSDFQEDPGYAFRLSEGMKALERSAAARGGLLSGTMLKGAQRYGQDMASQEYQNAFNRYQVNRSNQLNPLQSLMGAGQTATGIMGNAAGSYGAMAGQNMMTGAANYGAGMTDAARARASGYVGSANAFNNALSGIGNIYMQNRMLDTLRPLQTSGGYSYSSGIDGRPYSGFYQSEGY